MIGALKILLFYFAVSSASSLIFDCEFVQMEFGPNKSYDCVIHNLNVSESDLQITNVKQNHLAGFSNRDVKGVHINQQNCRQLPRGINKTFPSLRKILITGSSLEKITSEDLEPFPHLGQLNLSHNKLELLDGDLFKHSLNLRVIDFSHNKIKYLGLGILNPLKTVKILRFASNICTDVDCENFTKQQLFWFKFELSLNCSNPRNLEANK